jgi:hypothetical protein
MNNFAVILFHTTSAAIKAEKLLLGQGFTVKLIPTPRQFSSDCGVALRFDAAQIDAVREQINNNGLEISSIQVM